MKEFLYDIAKRMEIVVSDVQLSQFQIYYDYLLEMNKVMNLTAITEENEVVLKHFIDSISLIKYYEIVNGMKIIDVGTGAGFPGIPLAIMFPGVEFVLMDSLNKRILFLEEVVNRCKLENVSCFHSRAEELGKNMKYREQFDVCVSRAVANLSILLEYCIPFIKVGGVFVSYKSVLAEEELNCSSNAQKELSCSLIENFSFKIPYADYMRCFLFFEKQNETSKKYPRQNGIPKKNPL